jgi:hypothetical protein
MAQVAPLMCQRCCRQPWTELRNELLQDVCRNLTGYTRSVFHFAWHDYVMCMLP